MDDPVARRRGSTAMAVAAFSWLCFGLFFTLGLGAAALSKTLGLVLMGLAGATSLGALAALGLAVLDLLRGNAGSGVRAGLLAALHLGTLIFVGVVLAAVMG